MNFTEESLCYGNNCLTSKEPNLYIKVEIMFNHNARWYFFELPPKKSLGQT